MFHLSSWQDSEAVRFIEQADEIAKRNSFGSEVITFSYQNYQNVKKPYCPVPRDIDIREIVSPCGLTVCCYRLVGEFYVSNIANLLF